MHDNTGTIGSLEELRRLFPQEPLDAFRPVAQLTKRQAVTHRTLAYEPCPCGSGQKFKFCCHVKNAKERDAKQAERAARLVCFSAPVLGRQGVVL